MNIVPARTSLLRIGQFSSWAVFILGILYAIITVLGFLSLKSPNDPIADPFFTCMEILILLIAPLMAISMASVYYIAAKEDKLLSLIAAFFMFLMAGITSTVHFIILTANYLQIFKEYPHFASIFSFKWFSIVYAVDILAWNWFFPLSFFFAAPIFRAGRLSSFIWILMLISAVLSIAGLIGIPFNNVQYRNISILGYAVIAPIVFLLTGRLFGKAIKL